MRNRDLRVVGSNSTFFARRKISPAVSFKNDLKMLLMMFAECMVLIDGLGSLANIACASEDALLNCSLSMDSSKAVLSFLHTPVEKLKEQL